MARTQPPFLAEDEGDDERPEEGVGTLDDGETGENFSSPNRASWINGLATLLGGDPQKNGGDEATCVNGCSTQPPCKQLTTNETDPKSLTKAYRSKSTQIHLEIINDFEKENQDRLPW